MNVLEYATRDDLPEAAELHRRLQRVRHAAAAVIRSETGLSAATRRRLMAELDRELEDLGL